MTHPPLTSSMTKLTSSSNTNELEFEFGSPSSDPQRPVSSPADEFFLNGRLLPHSFPIKPRISTRRTLSSSSLTTTSRDSVSLVSSRSSSTNSIARTSLSDAAAELKAKSITLERLPNQGSNGNGGYSYKSCNHGSTLERWRLLISISPAPVLGPRSVSRRRRSYGEFGWKLSPKISKKVIKESGEEVGFWQRVLRSFVKSCKACHAMEEGAAVEDVDLDTFVELK